MAIVYFGELRFFFPPPAVQGDLFIGLFIV